MRDLELVWEHLFADQRGYLCLAHRAAGVVHEYYTWPDERGAAATRALELGQRRDVWFCVRLLAERRRAKATPGPVLALWCDLEQPLEPVDWPDDVPWPTAIVESGRGWHCYWRLSEPVDPAEAAQLSRLLAELLGGDLAAADAARLLRVPGTLNHKYQPPRPVRLRELLDGEAYPVETFRRLAAAPGNGHRPEPLRETLSRTIPVGQRHTTLVRVAGLLRGRLGLEPDDILAVLERLNQRCEEPLPHDELASIARSSANWAPGPLPGTDSSLVTPSGDRDDAVAVFELPEPAPRGWLVPDLVPERTTTILFGDDGTGKSVVATALAIAVACGQPFLGRPVPSGTVLYIDTEFDQDEFVRRAYALLRGYGSTSVPDDVRGRLRYARLAHSLSSPVGQQVIARLVERYQPTLVVIDSLTLGTYTDDLKDAAAAVRTMEFLQQLETTLVAIDHVPKPQPGTGYAYARPWGSFAKRAKARHAVLLAPADGGGLVLRVTKSNVARPGALVGLEVVYDADAIRVVPLRLDDEALSGIEQHLPPLELVWRTLARLGEATPDQLAEETGLAVGTVRNKLTALRKQGRVEPTGDGRWRAVTHVSLFTHYSESESDEGGEFANISHREAKNAVSGPSLAGEFANISHDDAKNAVCAGCGRPLHRSERGRPSRYCSPACRARARRAASGDGGAPTGRSGSWTSPHVQQVLEWAAQLLEQLERGEVALGPVEYRAGHVVTDHPAFLRATLLEAEQGSALAVARLVSYRLAAERLAVGA